MSEPEKIPMSREHRFFTYPLEVIDETIEPLRREIEKLREEIESLKAASRRNGPVVFK